jgi:hypothetical protein
MKFAKNIFVLMVVVCIAALSGCASKKESLEDIKPQDLTGSVKIETIEHKGSALGINQLPVWVQVYVERGIPGLEALSDFDGQYCFVGEGTGTNLNALTTWVSNYNVARDIASSVSNSVNAKFVGSETGSPQANYGSYYETVVTTTANATYSGARKLNDWWLLTRRTEPGSKKSTDEYRAYVLYTIDRQALDQQILGIMNQVSLAGSTEQQRAVNNVRAAMEREGLR